MNTDHRPVYIDLRKINLPISALISITHRISGIYVFFVTLPAALCLVYFSTKNVNTFNSVVNFLNGNLVLKTLIIFSFCVLWYHILSGVRHLIMDAHIGESLTASHYSAVFTIFLWVSTSGYIFWSLLT